jgi:pilus assembly protein CpaF
VISPCSIDGPTVTIRKFGKKKLQIEDLVKFGSVTPEMAEFLRACVVSRLNIIVAGGTGSGKTTLLNVLSNFIPPDERIVTIEDSAELKLGQEHVVRLESKPAEIDGSGRVSINDLVINSLRMRPERIVVGECRGGETMAMLQAMNTGHDGSLSTLHANAPREACSRMETMAMMAGMDMPLSVIREQIASAVDLIVQQTRLEDGSRKVQYITEVQGMEGDVIVLQDIFVLDIKGKSPDGKIISELRPTGTRPRFSNRLEAHGFKLPPSIFGATVPGGNRRW